MVSVLRSVGWWGIDLHVSTLVLLLIVIAVLSRVRQPARRLALGWSAAWGIVLLAVVSVLPGWPRLAWRRALSHEAGERSARPLLAKSEQSEIRGAAEAAPIAPQAASTSRESTASGRISSATPAMAQSGSQSRSGMLGVRMADLDYAAVFGITIVAGGLATSVWLLCGAVQAARLRRRSSPAGDGLNELFGKISDTAGPKPRLLVSADVSLPLAMGLFRPMIIVPQSSAERGPSAELEAAVAHEWAHVRHGDLWLFALLRLSLPLLFWQPLYWWLRRAIGTAQEELADAAACRGERVVYAEALLHWARVAAGDRPRGFNGALALWERPSQIKRRVAMLLDHEFKVELDCSRRRRATTAGLMLALALALSLPSLRRAASAADSDAPRRQVAISFTGRIVTQEKPASGAKVFLRESPVSWSRSEVGWRPSATRDIAETVADADGRFEFKDVKAPAPARTRKLTFPLDVIAIAPGRGMAWRHLAAAPAAPVELSLPEERKLAGQLVERDGKPVAGARVRVRELAGLRDPWRPTLHVPSYLDLELCGESPVATSDADGHFVLRGVPDGVRATLVVDDGRFLPRETCAAASDEPQDDLIEWLDGGKSRRVPVRSWYCKIEVERAYRLLGKVVFADSGAPAAGARFNHPPVLRPPEGVVDAEGRFTLTHLAPGSVHLRIAAPSGSSYLSVASETRLSGDHYDVEHLVRLPRGELVRGQVADAESGKGIGGAEIWYVSPRDSWNNPQPFVERAQSAADGQFALAVPPGKAELIVTGTVRGYVTYHQSGLVTAAPAEFHRAIDVQAGQPHPEVTFSLQPKPNATLIGRVADADWMPVAGAEIQYQGFGTDGGRRTTWPAVRTASDARGVFKLDDLAPSLEYGVRVVDHQRGLGAFALLSQLQTKQPALIVKLHPLATVVGRVVDERHEPLTAVIWLRVMRGGYGFVDSEPVATDADGHFDLTGLVPGVEYSVETRAEGYVSKTKDPFTPAAGESHVLGDIVLPPADRELSGVLVDADGKPVAGAQVRATSAADGQSAAVWTEVRVTDREGRFHLRGLPEGIAFVWQTFSIIGDQKRFLGQAAAGSQNLRFVGDKPSGGDPAPNGE